MTTESDAPSGPLPAPVLSQELSQPAMVRRYERRTDEPDDYTYDILWIDRTTGRCVLSYDGADPANTSAAYGAKPDGDVLAGMGLDIDEDIEIGRSVVPVDPREPERLIAAKARKAEREAEEAEAQDLLSFLGDAAASFDFGDWSKGERMILRPALEARGFNGVSFYMAEQDSFGPLIRGACAYDSTGKRVRFFYG